MARLAERTIAMSDGMLVLARCEGETIHLQSPKLETDVVITVTEISPGRVKLGISAPQHVNIVRDEILNRDGIFVRRHKD